MIAINWYNPLEGYALPFVHVGFLTSFFIANFLAWLVIPYGRRRSRDVSTSWGEAMLGAVYAFGVMFIAFGMVPNAFLSNAKEMGWTRDKIIYGPGGVLKPESLGGWNPMTLQYEIIRDTIVVLIHVYFFVIMCLLWAWWQRRGQSSDAKELPTSSYGRPLVKKT